MPPMLTPTLLSEKIRRSMVIIRIQPCLPSEWKLHGEVDNSLTEVWGIVVVCKNRFSYIIADSRAFVGKMGPRQRIWLEFPDGNVCWIQLKDIRLEESIVGISIKLSSMKKFNVSSVKGVELYEGPLQRCQQVYTYTPENSLLTPGFIMLANNQEFQHNCGGSYDAEFGAAVINKQGQLLGMNSYFHSDYTTAINTSSIATLISMCEKRNFMSIQDTLQHLRNQ